jgi:hypothetical protein
MEVRSLSVLLLLLKGRVDALMPNKNKRGRR